MDISVTKDTVRVSDPVFDAVADHPVDSDVILPDYCPDIARILKTEAEACVDSKTIEVGRLTINGSFCVRVIYIPENSRNIRCVTHETPFSHSFDIKYQGEMLHAKAGVRVAFANCRPVGPRRLQIRGSLAIAGKLWSERDEEFLSGSDDDRVELLTRPMMASNLVGVADKPFPVHEELEVGFGKPSAAMIVKSEAVAKVTDYKLISNKIIAKGELLVKTLYSPNNDDNDDSPNTLETMEHTIPISQIFDMEGVDEDCGCDIRFNAGFVKAEPKTDGDGENKLFDINLPVTASIKAWRTKEFQTVSDAYSPQFEMNTENKEISFENVADHIKNNEMVHLTVDLGDMSIGAVNDCSVKAAVTTVKFEGDTLELSGDMNVSMIVNDTVSGPASVDKVMPFAIKQELKNVSETMRCEPDIKVMSAGYNLSGDNRVDVRVDCEVEAMVYSVNKENAITQMNLDTDNAKQSCGGKTLTLYYADKGERLWDIAKRYNTSMNAVKKENNLDVDSLDQRSMLLIPKKRCARS